MNVFKLLIIGLVFCFLPKLEAQTILPGAQEQESWQQKVAPLREFDFGDVPIGKREIHSFPIHNTSDQNISIRSVSVSCGCMTAKIKKKKLLPGEKTKLVVALNTERFRGKKSASIHLLFDNPIKEIKFSASVNIRNLYFEPESLNFENNKKEVGEKQKQEFSITRGGSPFWKVTEVKASSSSIRPKIKGRKIEGSKVVYTIECEFEPGAEELAAQQEIVLTTNDSKEKEVSIPVVIRAQQAVKFAPDNLDFGSISKEPVKLKLFVQTEVDTEVSGLSFQDDGPFTAVEIMPAKKKIHVIEVTCNAGLTNAIESKLSIELNDGELSGQVDLKAEVSK